jgi:hypothetical protein
MPAYRSQDEADIREAVVARLRLTRPQSRIIHEINTTDFGNRIDVLAVGPSEIIAVEIKSKKDKLTRLPAQLIAMRGAAHISIAAIHEKFLVERTTNPGAAHRQEAGVFYRGDHPAECDGAPTWVFPERRRVIGEGWHDQDERWTLPAERLEQSLPAQAIHMLWREEVFGLCSRFGIAASRRTTMPQMIAALRWHCSGAELTKGICSMLRTRQCCEADPAILQEIAA